MQNTEEINNMNMNMNKPQITAPKKKRRASSLDRIKARSGWFFILPFVVGFVIIYLPIIVESVYFSFTEIRGLQGGGFEAIPVGFDNYSEALFGNPDFVRILSTGIQRLLFDIPAIVIFSLFMAILLNQKMTGRAVFRAIFFLPVILSTGIIDRIDQGNAMLAFMGNTNQTINDANAGNAADAAAASTTPQFFNIMDFAWLFSNMRVTGVGDFNLVVMVIRWVNDIFLIVTRSGVQMLIFLGGLQSISPAIYESAFMEGASPWESFWKITFPMISPMIFVCAVYTVIDSFTTMQNPVMRLIERTFNDTGGRVISSAMSWIYFLIVILIILVVGLIVSSFVFYQRREN
jgi:ABC-type sugar transport system permease subunit